MVWAAALLAVAGCSIEAVDTDTTRRSEQNIDVTGTQNLTRVSLSPLQTNEALRQANTTDYYNTVGTSDTGGGSKIGAALATLAAFRTRYGFGGANEQIARYYNRGDLGIGREMHCVDNINTTKREIACYVVNFAAGDDNTEFFFGQSPDIAYKNMDTNRPFATVAMVYRDKVVGDNQVFFVVYGANGTITNNAALDRVGYLHATGLDTRSTPGVDFNNHIPSNCLNCHGGSYASATKTVTEALFLPFDLDQFDYQDVPGRRRADQLTVFKRLNEMAWKVAARSGAGAGPTIVAQLNGWYQNTPEADSRNEVLNGNFDSNFVPPNWDDSARAIDVYRSVVRPACRGCHMANRFSMDSESFFLSSASVIAADICDLGMPHALQTAREFWQSSMPEKLSSYYTQSNKAAAAATIQACGPKDVVTLDPDDIMGAQVIY